MLLQSKWHVRLYCSKVISLYLVLIRETTAVMTSDNESKSHREQTWNLNSPLGLENPMVDPFVQLNTNIHLLSLVGETLPTPRS